MNYPKGLLYLLLATLLTGCATMEITTDHDPTFNFSRLKSYDWLPNPQEYFGDHRIEKEALEMRIKKAVDRKLAEKKYVKSTSTLPDFYIRYHAQLTKERQVVNVSDAPGMGGDWNDQRSLRLYRQGGGKIANYSWDKGTLLIEVVNPENKKIIWIGTAAAKIDLYDSDAKKEERINRAVRKMFADFPPQSQ